MSMFIKLDVRTYHWMGKTKCFCVVQQLRLTNGKYVFDIFFWPYIKKN